MYPYLINFGFIKIRFYGFFYALALYLGIKIFGIEAKRKNFPLTELQVQNLGIYVFLFCLLCARLYYVLFNLDWYFSPEADWYEFLAIWRGGLAIHGSAIGGLISIIYISRRYKIKFLDMLDMSIILLLGQALGRIGNFFNGDAHGIPTDLPWGMIFKYGPASVEFSGIPLHPVMLYESILSFILFIFLWRFRLKNIKSGLIGCLYIIFSSLIRSFVTIFRADDLFLWVKYKNGLTNWFVGASNQIDFGIRAPHAISVVFILFGIYLIFKNNLLSKNC